jgi:hypothetical protein
MSMVMEVYNSEAGFVDTIASTYDASSNQQY